MKNRFADVSYRGSVYRDAHHVDNGWFFEDWVGALHRFAVQEDVTPLTPLTKTPRHLESFSGHIYSRYCKRLAA
jgi:hypothetical protein